MKAITTTWHGPAGVRGSRIVARDSDGNRVIVLTSHALNHDDNHKAAALALCQKMGWSGTLVMGSLGPNQEVFVWAETHTTLNVPLRSKRHEGAKQDPREAYTE